MFKVWSRDIQSLVHVQANIVPRRQAGLDVWYMLFRELVSFWVTIKKNLVSISYVNSNENLVSI